MVLGGAKSRREDIAMLIIGERINSTRTKIQEAIKIRNAAFILREVSSQLKAGVHFIDINCAVTSGDEVQEIDWLVSVVQSEFKEINLCIDSPNYLAIDRALKVYKASGSLMINSITGEEDRIKKILPIAIKHNAKLIALTMGDKGMPSTAEERFDIARDILEKVRKAGFNPENLYFDPLTRPVSTEPEQAKEFLKSIPLIKGLGGVKVICGLSNISFGLPDRHLINSVFLAMAIQSGIDAAIMDPTDKSVMSSITASAAILNSDEYCVEYLKAFREGRLI